MKLLDKKTAIDTVKLTVFVLVTTLLTSMLVVTIGNLSFGGTKEYRAEFVDATGVVTGDDVRIAGVKVGSVTEVEIVDRTRALVSFKVEEATPLSGATEAAIRYRNLVGQRYLSLTETIGDTGALDEGATIPVDRTSPALDLTVLFNGFKPLFQALSPEDLNKLSFEVIRVFQGEGGTLEGLLQSTASVTQTLADRDKVISDLIDNLNQVLVADRQPRRGADRADLLVPHLHRRSQGRPGGHPGVAGADLGPLGRDRRPGLRHPQALRRGHRAAAHLRRQHRPQQGRARPGPAGAPDQAAEGGPDRDLRLLLQLLPVRVPRHRTPAQRPGLRGPRLPDRLREV